MRSFKTYNFAIFALILVFLSIPAAFSWFVDPYDIFGNTTFKHKPMVAQKTRIVKAFQIESYGADGLILGSSRAAAGLDPSLLPGRVYNMGLPGANVAERFAYLKHAHAANPLKTLILQPDFFSFNAWEPNKPNFNTDILYDKTPSQMDYLQYQLEKYLILVNIDHFLDSLVTIRSQNQNKISVNLYKSNGFQYPEHRLRRLKQIGGSKIAFDKGIERYVQEIWFPKPDKKFAFDTGDYNSFETFEDILKFAKEENIETKIILAAVHADHVKALIEKTQLGPLWEEWRSQIFEINERVAGFPIYDFTEFEPYVSEPVPDEKGAVMKWYLDNAHYNAALGKILLEEIQ